MLAMDENNVVKLKGIAPKHCKAKILLFSDFDSEDDRIIRDPYFVSFIIIFCIKCIDEGCKKIFERDFIYNFYFVKT